MSALVASDEGQSPAPQAQLRQKSMEANGALAKKEAVKSVKAGAFPAELFKEEKVEEAAVRGAAMGAEDMEVEVEVEAPPAGKGKPEAPDEVVQNQRKKRERENSNVVVEEEEDKAEDGTTMADEKGGPVEAKGNGKGSGAERSPKKRLRLETSAPKPEVVTNGNGNGAHAKEEGEEGSDSEEVPPTPPLTRQQRAALLVKDGQTPPSTSAKTSDSQHQQGDSAATGSKTPTANGAPAKAPTPQQQRRQPSSSPPSSSKKASKGSSGSGKSKSKSSVSASPPRRFAKRKPRGKRKKCAAPRCKALGGFVRKVGEERKRLEVEAVMKEAQRLSSAQAKAAQGGQGGSAAQSALQSGDRTNLGSFFPQSSYGNQLHTKSSAETYGPHHGSCDLFDREVLMAGRQDAASSGKDKLKQNTRSEKKERGSLPLPLLSSALLARKDMDAYGYGCPAMVDPRERRHHKKVQFKIKKSALIKPDAFRSLLRARARALRRYRENGNRLDEEIMIEEQKREEVDPAEQLRLALEHLDGEEAKHRGQLTSLRDELSDLYQKREDSDRQRDKAQAELKRLQMERKNLVVELKHVASTVHQQKALLTSPAATPFGLLGAAKSPSLAGTPAAAGAAGSLTSAFEVEEGEVKGATPATMVGGMPRRTSSWGGPLRHYNQ